MGFFSIALLGVLLSTFGGSVSFALEATPIALSREEAILSQKGDPEERTTAPVVNGERKTVNVPVISWRDLPFQTVKRQAYDYSCGSAAVATLLTYVYGAKTSESDVFQSMFAAGDQAKIKREGFSLLDMSSYLKERGFKAVGYRLDLDKIQKAGVPFIALINNNGYNHFVVVKSVREHAVLVGDPNKGNVVYSRSGFSDLWNGIALIVTNFAGKARAAFGDDKDWRFARYSTRPDTSELSGLADVHSPLMNTQIAPTGIDLLTTLLNVTGGISQIAVQTQ